MSKTRSKSLIKIALCGLGVPVALVPILQVGAVAAERVFTVPLDKLREWSAGITTSMNVQILGHSAVHDEPSDCEMHLGAKAADYTGDPAGWVLEPMNLCLEPFPGKSTASKKDWESFGDDLKQAKVHVEGVPRIWPEHLVGGRGPSNPNHALELHPLTRLQRGPNDYKFSSFIYAPDKLEGISDKTIRSILTDSEVSVTEKDGEVEINLDTGTIGNFAIVDLSFSTSAIKAMDGGFRIDGEAVLSRKESVPVSLVMVGDCDIGKSVAELRGRKQKKYSFEALVLFSLNPVALYQAAKTSNGKEVAVPDPIQLIVYGETGSQ